MHLIKSYRHFNQNKMKFLQIFIHSLLFVNFIAIFVNAKSFFGPEMNARNWHQPRGASKCHHSSSHSSSNSDEFFDISSEEDGESSSDGSKASKKVEVTFDCYPQTGNVLRSRPQHQNRTVKRSARIKLNLHCEKPKMTKLAADFLMECGSNKNRYFDYKEGYGQAKNKYKISKCAYSVGATCRDENEEMDISNLCGDDCPTNPCDSIEESGESNENEGNSLENNSSEEENEKDSLDSESQSKESAEF